MKTILCRFKKIFFSVLLAALILSLTSCGVSSKYKMVKYYSDESNFIAVNGVVDWLNYNDARSMLYLSFSNMDTALSDNCFKIVGDNLKITQQNGIDSKLQIGDSVCFITAPRYFGDGYVMPIVEITVNGEKLLAFDEGHENLLMWLKQ